MQKLQDRHGSETVARALRHLSIRLKSRPETQPLVTEVEAMRTEILKTEEAWNQAQEERVAATAEITYLDKQLDQTVMALAREVAVLTGNKTQDPRHIKLFPAAPSNLIKPIAGESQERFVRSLINRLREDADYSSIKQYADILEKQQQALSQALARREQFYQPEAKTQTDRRIVLDRARRLYQATFNRLQLLYPGDPALVESFFSTLRAYSRSTGAEESQDPEESTADEAKFSS